jgi:hypothetical protein
MFFYTSIPLELDSNASQAFASNSQTTLPNVFGRMISNSQPAAYIAIKDKCLRPTSTYNNNYNPDILRDNLPGGYSSYVREELLYNDRPVIIA